MRMCNYLYNLFIFKNIRIMYYDIYRRAFDKHPAYIYQTNTKLLIQTLLLRARTSFIENF